MKIVVNIYGLHDRLRSGSWQVTLLISGTKLELGNTVHPRLSEPHLSEPRNNYGCEYHIRENFKATPISGQNLRLSRLHDQS